LFEISINHAGLSLGEIEAINNLFSDYPIYENTVDNDFEYASILELEFIKYKDIAFFDFIPIEKWTTLIEIIKNIKKRRGKKGLRFKIIITEGESDKYNEYENENEEEPISFNKTIFILNHKNDLEFIKGLERIEITIENLVEIYEFQKLKEEQKVTNNNALHKVTQNEPEKTPGNIIIFSFNEINRKWIRFTDNKLNLKKGN
jgi:hypothetical protein